jgi:hypothetical protein
MRLAFRHTLLLLAALPAVGLAACGGGGSTTTTTVAAVPPPASTAATATTPTAPATPTATSRPTATAKPPATTPRPAAPSGSTGTSSNGPSASFRVAHGDNSIPDFGGEAPTTERQRATAALKAFLHARTSRNWSQACLYLAAPTLKQISMFARSSKGKASCGTILAALSRSSTPTGGEDTLAHGIAALRIKGDTAFALYHGAGSSKYVMPMRNEGGAWKMTELAPLAYPLGSTSSAP